MNPPADPHPPSARPAGQPARGAKRRSPLLWVGLGCGCLVMLCGGGSLTVAVVALGAMRQSDAYQLALAEVRDSPAVEQALGEPIEPGWWLTGSIETSGATGTARLSFPISGPKGDARVYLDAVKRAGQWQAQSLEVELASGERLDLLDEGGASFDVISEFLARTSRGDYAAAHELFSQGLRQTQPLAEFRRAASGAAALFQTRELRLARSRGADGPQFEGTLLLRDGREIEASFGLIREGVDWRIHAYHIGAD